MVRSRTYSQDATIFSSSTLRSQPPKTGIQKPYFMRRSAMRQLGDTGGFGGLKPVGKLGEGIEADDVDAVRDEVGERIDVVVEALSVAIVRDVFDAANLDACVLHDALDIGDDLTRRLKAFHAQSALGRVDGTRGAIQFDAAGGAADVRRAQVGGLAGDVEP